MANDFFSRTASKIGDLFTLLAAPTVTSQHVVARSSLEVSENKLEDIKAILNNIKAMLYDSGRQIRDDAIKKSLKELQYLVIVVEDFVDNCQYKMFQSEAKFMRRRWRMLDIVDDYPYKESPTEDFLFWKFESSKAEGNTFEKWQTDAFRRRDRTVAIAIPNNIAVGIVGIKRTFDYLAHHQKDQKCASHLLLISQEKQNSEKLQRVTEFIRAESSSLKSMDAVRGRKHYHAFDVTKQIYGRNSDRENIINWLLSANSRFSLFEDERSRNKFSAITIVGMAGVGKTTLAKGVYNDPVVCKYFNSRIWLHFTEECDAVSLSKSFFVSITGKSCDGKEPVPLQSVMKEELNGKMLFLVLDDPENLNLRL